MTPLMYVWTLVAPVIPLAYSFNWHNVLLPNHGRPRSCHSIHRKSAHSDRGASNRCRLRRYLMNGSFRTEVHTPQWPPHLQLDYADSFLLLGSCFSDNMGSRLSQAKLQAAVNPSHGIVFSPMAVCDSLDRMIGGEAYKEDDDSIIFSEAKGLWSSLDHHSSFDSTSRRDCLDGINAALVTGRESLLAATCIFVTLGTAWVFRHREIGKNVANCHKIPPYHFDRYILPVEDIEQTLCRSLSKLVRANSRSRIMLTVSPVRHWRDGPVENARSKAHLLAGAHGAIDLLRSEGIGVGGGLGSAGHVSYFPSYEMVNDDLRRSKYLPAPLGIELHRHMKPAVAVLMLDRDYRFYEADMIHPNAVAVEYVWDKLVAAMFKNEAVHTMAEVNKIMQATQHRPFNPKSHAHQRFLRSRLKKLDDLECLHPSLDLDAERAFFESQVVVEEVDMSPHNR